MSDEEHKGLMRSPSYRAMKESQPIIDLVDSDDEEEENGCEQVWPPVSRKQPRMYIEEDDEEILDAASKYRDDFRKSLMCYEVFEQPDLAEYFANFDMEIFAQISLCRTYANYLAQKLRAEKSKKPYVPITKKSKK